MAKGNIFTGTLKGRIGDNVFYIQHGEQNVIKYQPNVSNPKTAPQMYQRSRFLAANKFYTRGRQAFFKFAFENKRKGESDFNAFMRENIKNAPNITRDAFDVTNYPIIGNFTLTRGSLEPLPCGVWPTAWNVSLNVPHPNTALSTVGELSTYLVQFQQYQAGDIITLLFINSKTAANVPSVKPSVTSYAYGSPEWNIIQFKLNPLDVTELTDLGLWLRASTDGTLQLIGDEGTDFFPVEYFAAFTAVHSRMQHGRLKVSTARLTLNELSFQAVDDQNEQAYIQAVIADWQTAKEVPVQSEVILKGALAKSKVAGIDVEGEAIVDSLFDLSSDTQGDINFGSPLLQPSGEYPIGYYKTESLGPSNFSVVPIAQGTKVNLISFEQGPATGVIRAKVATPDSGDGAFYRYAVYVNNQVQSVYLGYIEFELAESEPTPEFTVEILDTDVWQQDGDTYERTEPLAPGNGEPIGDIFKEGGLTPAVVSYRFTQGGENVDVLISQSGSGVLVGIEAQTGSSGQQSVEILYTGSEENVRICQFNFEISNS